MERKFDDKEPFSALAFKVATDPFVGTLTFIRLEKNILGKDNTLEVEKEKI